MTKTDIPPGGEGEIKVTFSTGSKKGATSKTITVTSNDPETPSTVLRVKAEIELDFDFENRSLHFGKLRRGEGQVKTTYLLVKNPEGVEITDIKSTSPHISAKQVDFTDQQGEYHRFMIEVEISAEMPPGRINETITVHSNLEKKPTTELRVSGIVSGYIETSPEWLTYLTSDLESPLSERTKHVFITNHQEDIQLEILDYQDPSGNLGLELKTLREGVKYQLTAILKEDALSEGQKVSGNIRLTTNHPQQQNLTVRYTAAKRSDYQHGKTRKQTFTQPGKDLKPGEGSVFKSTGNDPFATDDSTLKESEKDLGNLNQQPSKQRVKQNSEEAESDSTEDAPEDQ